MLTTFDNPFNPFTHFDEWRTYDSQKGYNTCEYLARIATPALDISDEDNEVEIEKAMNEICNLNPSLYKIIEKDA